MIELYIENVFIRHINKEIKCCQKIDIVWVQYFQRNIKEPARKKRHLIRKKVNLVAKVPADWFIFYEILHISVNY